MSKITNFTQSIYSINRINFKIDKYEYSFIKEVFDAFIKKFEKDKNCVIPKSIPSVEECKSDSEVANVFFDIFGISEEERKDIEKKIPLAQDSKSFHKLGIISTAYNAIPMEKIIKILESKIKHNIVDIFINVPNNQEFDNIITHSLSLITDKKRDYKIGMIFRAIATIPIEKRDEVIPKLIPIVKNKKATEIAAVFYSTNAIEERERTDVISVITQSAHILKKKDAGKIGALLRKIHTVPKEWRDHVIATDAILFLQDKSEKEIESIFLRISHVQEEAERIDVMARVSRLLKGKNTSDEIVNLFLCIAGIPKADRDNVMNLATPLIKNKNGYEIAQILFCISRIPENERADVVERAVPLMKGKNGEEIAQILSCINVIQSADRVDIITKVTPFAKDKSGHQITTILSCVSRVPEEQRTRVIVAFSPIVKNKTIEELTAILGGIGAISGEERADVIERAAPFTKGKNGEEIAQILSCINRIPKADRVDIITKVRPFAKDKNGHQIVAILSCVSRVPEEQRTRVIVAFSFIVKNKTIEDLTAILRRIDATPGEERADVIERAAPFTEGKNGGEIAGILYSIAAMPKGERADVIERATPFTEDKNNGHEIAGILSSIAAMPTKGERADIIERAAPFTEGKNGHEIAGILYSIAAIPKGERADVIERAVPFTEGKNGYEIASILYSIIEVGAKRRTDVLDKIAALVRNNPNYKEESILKAISYFPENEYNTILSILRENNTHFEDHYNIINFVVETNNTLKEPLFVHLRYRLESIPHVVQAFSLAKDVLAWRNRNQPLLHDTLTIQKAEVIRIIVEKEEGKAYAIHRQLVAMPSAAVEFSELPMLEMEGQSFQLNPDAFRDRRKVDERFADLPPNIDFSTLRSFFNQFENRFASLNQADKEKVEECIKNTFVCSYETLRHNLLESDFIRRTLIQDEDSKEKFQLFKIVEYLANKRFDQSMHGPLSAQEEALFRVARSLEGCSAAKSTGLSILYNGLGLSSIDVETDAIQRPKFLHSIVDEIIDNLFHDTDMFKELAEIEAPSNQMVHDTLYVKNVIGRHIGLRHKLQFDLYGALVSDGLLKRSLADILRIFYKHLKIETFIDSLISKVAEDPKGIYQALNSFLQEVSQKESSEIWELTEDLMNYQLTKKGAIEIWLASGFLKLVPDKKESACAQAENLS